MECEEYLDGFNFKLPKIFFWIVLIMLFWYSSYTLIVIVFIEIKMTLEKNLKAIQNICLGLRGMGVGQKDNKV